MINALQKMVEAMGAELERQADVPAGGQLGFADASGLGAEWRLDGRFDLEKLARVALMAALGGGVSLPAHHGRHPWCQPGDRPDQVWMLRFDDNDRRDMIWTDADAELQARAAYAKSSPSWNCYLFAVVPA